MSGEEPGSSGIAAARPSLDLPVIQIARRAFYLPVRYPIALIKLGGIPALITIAIQLGASAMIAAGVLNRVAPIWIILAGTIAYVPFAVGWTRLAYDGPARVARRGPFHFRRTEGLYLLAIVVFSTTWVAVLLPLSFLNGLAIRSLDTHLRTEVQVLTVGALFVLAIALVRSLYILPAVALNEYRGVAAAWRLSKCSFERLLLIETIAHLPYLIALAVLNRMNEPYYPIGDRASFAVLQWIAWMFGQAFAAGAVALAYKDACSSRPHGAEGS